MLNAVNHLGIVWLQKKKKKMQKGQNAKCSSKYRQFVSMPLCALMEKSDQMKGSLNYQSLNQGNSTELELIYFLWHALPLIYFSLRRDQNRTDDLATKASF